MTDTQTETQHDEQDAALETQLASEMTPDEGETPDEDATEQTGPGPESPFQPPDLHPDEDGDGDGSDDGETETETVENYAPGVAEARLRSEREAEALGKKLDAERKRHGRRVMELLGDDLGGHIPCPTCMDGIDGFIVSPEFAPLDTEQRNRMMQVLGLDDWGQMSTADWAQVCGTCQGFGKIKTGSHVPGREVIDCEDCQGAGYQNTRKRAQLASVPEPVPTGDTGPTVYQDHEPDPRVDALRRDGFTVIPPMVMTNSGS